MIFGGDPRPILPRINRAVNAVNGSRYKNVGVRRRRGKSAHRVSIQTDKLPVAAGVRAAINSAAMRTERPAGGVQCVRRARIHNDGHNHVVMICADPAKLLPVLAAILGTKYMAVGGTESGRWSLTVRLDSHGNMVEIAKKICSSTDSTDTLPARKDLPIRIKLGVN